MIEAGGVHSMRATATVLAVLCLASSSYAQSADTGNEGKPIVFVHGAFGGGWDYRGLEDMLEEQGRRVHRVTLTGLGERSHLASPEVDLETHIQDVVNVLEFEELTGVILVGHSYGGMVITGVAHRTPERIHHLVYIDAMLPLDGESVKSLMSEENWKWMAGMAEANGDGWRLPPFWPDPGKDVPHPFETFRQPVELGNLLAERIPGTFVLTLEPDAETDDFSRYAKRAKERGYDYLEWRTGHNPQRTMPAEYVAFLLGIE
jgi:pimeloyl-ACP methyl ester carboxylesterase